MRAFAGRWQAFVAELDEAGLNYMVTVPLGRNRTAQVAVWQVIHELFTHAPYHRGQLITLLRQVGGRTLNTDPLIYYMQG